MNLESRDHMPYERVPDNDLLSLKDAIQGSYQCVEALLKNPKLYETLKKNNEELGNMYNLAGYSVIEVEPADHNYMDYIEGQQDFYHVLTSGETVEKITYINSQGEIVSAPDYYYGSIDDTQLAQRDLLPKVMNVDVFPAKYSSHITPAYKVILQKEFKVNIEGQAEPETITDIVELYLYDSVFFQDFELSLPLENSIASIATISYRYHFDGVTQYYIADKSVDKKEYFTYLLYKKQNMIPLGKKGGTEPTPETAYRNLTYEYFSKHVYSKMIPYNLPLEQVKEALNK